MYHGHRNLSKPDGSTGDSWFTYTCGHCGATVAGAVVAHSKNLTRWLECTSCGKPSSALGEHIFPGQTFGPRIEGLPSTIDHAYQEARNCMSASAFTGAELLCRKILMNIAVEKGAAVGGTFASYLDYLEDQRYITPGMKSWVDLIRRHGNLATHELEPPERSRAEATLVFTAELLRIIYEMDYYAKNYRNILNSQ